MDFGKSLGTSEVLDVRRQGAPTEAYIQYGARRSDRPSSVAGYPSAAIAFYGGRAAEDGKTTQQTCPAVALKRRRMTP